MCLHSAEKTQSTSTVFVATDTKEVLSVSERYLSTYSIICLIYFRFDKQHFRKSDGNGVVEVNKTGMGSSAALTTSLVGALLQWFGVVRLGQRKGDDDRRLVHNLSQLAHAVAQGKIGSGFDVATAVYGTLLHCSITTGTYVFDS